VLVLTEFSGYGKNRLAHRLVTIETLGNHMTHTTARHSIALSGEHHQPTQHQRGAEQRDQGELALIGHSKRRHNHDDRDSCQPAADHHPTFGTQQHLEHHNRGRRHDRCSHERQRTHRTDRLESEHPRSSDKRYSNRNTNQP
jgi:hypothetical protein